jgi:hypothetical protein
LRPNFCRRSNEKFKAQPACALGKAAWMLDFDVAKVQRKDETASRHAWAELWRHHVGEYFMAS